MNTIIDPFPIWDTVEEKGYNCTDTLDVLVDLLNEQQYTIQSLKEENEQLRQSKEILQQEIGDTQKILEMLSEKLKGWNDE